MGNRQAYNNYATAWFPHMQQGSFKKIVIALLHVAVIHHQITRYRRYITPAASHAIKHVYQPVLRGYTLSGGLLMEASPTCFCALLAGIETSVLRHQMQLHPVYSQRLLQQPLYQHLRAQKQTSLSQSVLFQNSLSQGLTFSQRSPVTPVSLTAFTGLFQSRQDGGHSSVPNLRSLGSSPCDSG